MPVVPAASTLTAQASAVTLARYAQVIGYPECAFFGVRRDGDETGECRDIWTKPQRDMVARYLAEAQEEIENEIGYFLSPRWVVGTLSDEPNGNDRYVDAQPYRLPLLARWPKILATGARAETTIQANATVDHTNDPAVVGPLATTVTDPSEIAVFHPGTDVEITPSAVSLSGGNVAITIPRCRLVKADRADNPSTGLDYTDLTNFESAVDVKRVYTDDSVGAKLVWPHTCTAACAANGCTETTQDACIYVKDPALGVLHVRPAAYLDGSWVGASLHCCGQPARARLNYRAGLAALTRQAEDTIIRLAHSKMPEEPCGCEIAQRLWKRDRHVPEVLTRERLNCPWGLNDGAWIAWRFAQTMKVHRGSVL